MHSVSPKIYNASEFQSTFNQRASNKVERSHCASEGRPGPVVPFEYWICEDTVQLLLIQCLKQQVFICQLKS